MSALKIQRFDSSSLAYTVVHNVVIYYLHVYVPGTVLCVGDAMVL